MAHQNGTPGRIIAGLRPYLSIEPASANLPEPHKESLTLFLMHGEGLGRENKIKRARRALRGFVDVVDGALNRKVGRPQWEPQCIRSSKISPKLKHATPSSFSPPSKASLNRACPNGRRELDGLDSVV